MGFESLAIGATYRHNALGAVTVVSHIQMAPPSDCHEPSKYIGGVEIADSTGKHWSCYSMRDLTEI